MRENQRDLLCLCLSGAGITFTNLWPSFFTYYTSLSYYNNPNIRVNQIYATYFFFLIGKLLGSVIYPYMFFVCGTTFMYIIFVTSEIFMGFCSQYYVSFLAISLVNLQKGLLFQGVISASNIILSEKFEKGILKSKHINTARILSSVVGTFLCQYLVNPENLSQNIHDQSGDYFFPKQIAINFQSFLLLYSIVCAMFISMPLFFVQCPSNYDNKLKQYIKYLVGKGTFDFQIKNKISESKIDLDNSYSLQQSRSSLNQINKSSLPFDKKQNDNLEEELTQKNILKEKINLKFIHCLGIFVAINFGICYYCIQIYKYIALILNFSDILISTILTLALIPYIASSYLATYLWSNYGFEYTIGAIAFFNISNLIGIIFSKSYFILQVFITRQNGGFILIFQDIFCFSLFDTFEAMNYVKYFMFYNTLGNLSQIFMNFLFFDAQNYRLIFIMYLCLCLLSVFVHFKYLHGKIQTYQN